MNLLLFGAPGTGKGTQAVFLTQHYKLRHISTGDLFRKALNEKTPLGLKAKSYMDQGKLVPDSIVISLIEEVLSGPSPAKQNAQKSAQKNAQKSAQKSTQRNARQNTMEDIQKKPPRSDTQQAGAKEREDFVPDGGGFILDGFPRTPAQATALDLLLNKLSRNLHKVLCLNVPEVVLIERITGRRVAEKSGRVYHVKFNPPKKPGVCDQSGEPLIHRKDDTAEVVQIRLKAYREQTAPLIEYYRAQDILASINGQGTPEKVFARIQQVLD